MYSIHNLAHRAPATRTRVRWQPYASLPQNSVSVLSSAISSSSQSPSSTYNNSPYSSAPSSPASAPRCEPEAPKQSQSTPQPSQHSTRDAQPREKNKFALGLVDQAVKTLCDIWRPQDIPQIFLTNSRPLSPDLAHSHLIQNKHHSSLHSAQTPPPSLFATSIHNADCEAPVGPTNLVPMKGFVHEVLRRSRTSGSVLQTALCYLEAIRPKISELIQQDETFQEPELADRITVATEAELAQEAEFCIGTDTIIQHESDDLMDTIRISDSYSGSTAVSSGGIIEDGESTLKKTKTPSPTLSPLPPLPSPLLCPRRAFLAALILASKFTQDKCYSNRAWAKLSGLPPREIGRCERALGDALDWRLWVGKSSSQSQGASAVNTPAASSGRTLSRCRSESSIPSGSSDSSSFLSGSTTSSDNRPSSSPTVAKPSPKNISENVTRSGAGLRRAVTLPAEAFALKGEQQSNSSRGHMASQWIHNDNKSDQFVVDATMYSPEKVSSTLFEHGPMVPLGSQIAYPTNPSDVDNTTPPTPGLSYSPTSTESSSGDRTIQMACFLDDKSMIPPDGGFSSVSTSLSGIPLETWPWLDRSPSGAIAVTSTIGCIFNAMQDSLTGVVAPFPGYGSLGFEKQSLATSIGIPQPVYGGQ